MVDAGQRVVDVVPATAGHLRALLAGPDTFRAEYGLRVVDGYLEFDGVLEHALAVVTSGGHDPAWQSHLFVHTGDRALIGLGGFKGPPRNGTVEIGYGIAPTYRGQGHATAAAAALIERAQAAGVTTVVAHTLAEPNASTRVLQHLGFRCVATVEDADVGAVWRWQRDLHQEPAGDGGPSAPDDVPVTGVQRRDGIHDDGP